MSEKGNHGEPAAHVHGERCTPGITFYNKMKALFAPFVGCMNNNGIDLSKYASTGNDDSIQDWMEDRPEGPGIKTEIDSGRMPKSPEAKKTWAASNGKFWFDCWYAQGWPEGSPSDTTPPKTKQ